MGPNDAKTVSSLLPLNPIVFNVLLVLIEEERHGYSIVREIEARMGDGKRIEPGNLYRTLRTLLSQGLIEETGGKTDSELDDQRRRYFRISDLGLQVARAEARRLEGLVTAARTHNLLAGPGGRV